MKEKYFYTSIGVFLFVMGLLRIEHGNEVGWGIFEVVVGAVLIVIYSTD